MQGSAGVCFTKTPESHKHMVIEACLGLGEALVSGAVTPDNYIVNRDMLNVDKTSIGYQKVMLKKSEYEPVPFHKRNAKKLTNPEIEELSRIALKIEQSLKFNAADIEWAFEKEELYILQAREFTGI